MSDPKRVAVLARQTAARTVAAAFMPAELGVEQAALDGINCIKVMIEQRKLARLPQHVGTEEMVLIAEGVAKALESYRLFAQAHERLVKIPTQNDLDDTFGPACGKNITAVRATEDLDREAA